MTMQDAPIAREIAWSDPADLFASVAYESYALLLESARADRAAGRYSFIALDPPRRLEGRVEADGRGKVLLDDLEDELARHALAVRRDLPPFQTGAAGFFGYELNGLFEKLPAPRRDELGFPDLALGLYDLVISFDHPRRRAWIVSSGYPEREPRLRRIRAEERLRSMLARLEHARPGSPRATAAPPTTAVPRTAATAREAPTVASNFTAPAYREAVARVIEYIRAGDVFQVNLSQRFKAELSEGAPPFELYLRLRSRSAASFASFMDLGDRQIVSSSPERFLKLDGRRVETRPIKGTRPRGGTNGEDTLLARELLTSLKDRAENVMIVDLLRNDLSRVCMPRTVKVPALCALESYATVHHLVSTVTGEMRGGAGPLDLLRAAFPGGSVTGAPKIRAMEIIHELEPHRRGPYCGCIGYIGFDGTMDTSITIRSFTISGRRASFHAGGGVVLDSDPAAEYEETLAKARALVEAL